MTSVAISPKYQIVIPKAVREALKLRPGQRVEVSLDGAGRVLVEPELDMRSARGFLKPVAGQVWSEVPDEPESPEWPGGCEPLPDADWVRLSSKG